jgi:hypothetical protein
MKHNLCAQNYKSGFVHVFEVILGNFNVDKICRPTSVKSSSKTGLVVAVGGSGTSSSSGNSCSSTCISNTQSIYNCKQC